MTAHRVLHFLWSGEIGGAERAVYQLVREEMRRGDWEVGVAFGRAEGPWVKAIGSLDCEVIDLRMRSSADLPRALHGIERMRRFDIHHFHVLELAQLVASSRCPGVTRVFTQRHGEHTGGERVRKRIRRFLGGVLLRRHMHAVAGNTQHATRYAVARYRLQYLPAQVTYNGIDFNLLRPVDSRAQARDRMSARPDTTVVGSSGTFKAWKRFDRLVDLLGCSPDVLVLLIGDGPLRADFEARAEAAKAGGRLHITGLVEKVADYLQAIDIFILPSTADESFGNAVVEAMALGIPSVVFSDSPGICEHIQNGVTGFILDDPSELAGLVTTLSQEPDLRARIGQAGAQYVRSAYTLDNMHASYRHLYRAALERNGATK